MSQPNQPYQPYQQSPWPPAAQPTPVPPVKKRHRGLKITLGIIGGVFGFLLIFGIVGAALGLGEQPQNTAAAPSTTSSAAPTTAAPTTAAPSQPPATKAPATKAPVKPAPVTYAKISDRQWKLIAKDPDSYIGKSYVVYGEVTQFDAATGADTFRADVGGVQRKPSYGYVDYPTNTILTADAAKLTKLVEGDLFRAEVLVGGSMSYDTQIGGNTTVPVLIVSSIKVTGSTAS